MQDIEEFRQKNQKIVVNNTEVRNIDKYNALKGLL